jgi:hypothetical protein
MRTCLNCGSTNTYIDKKGTPYWRKGLCNKCACKDYSKKHPNEYKQYHNKWHSINDHKRIQFKDKRIQLKDIPRKGICSLCHAVKGVDCIRTSMHHMLYDDKNVLGDTVELCNSCHSKLHGLGSSVMVKPNTDKCLTTPV